MRTNDNVCQLLNRPTQLATNGLVFEGSGVSATPVTCTAYIAPVAPPVTAPVAAAPVAPPTPKKSIGSIVFSSSILVLAAGVVAFF